MATIDGPWWDCAHKSPGEPGRRGADDQRGATRRSLRGAAATPHRWLVQIRADPDSDPDLDPDADPDAPYPSTTSPTPSATTAAPIQRERATSSCSTKRAIAVAMTTDDSRTAATAAAGAIDNAISTRV